MTDEATDKANANMQPTAAAAANPEATSLSTANKAFWAGVGIGSTALMAALMYARRPKKRK